MRRRWQGLSADCWMTRRRRAGWVSRAGARLPRNSISRPMWPHCSGNLRSPSPRERCMFPGKNALFLVWGPPSHGPRSQVLARELGIEALHFVHITAQRGLLLAPFRYAVQAVQTLLLLFRKRPELVLVQSPPSLA